METTVKIGNKQQGNPYWITATPTAASAATSLSSDLGEAANVNGVSVGWGLGTVWSPSNNYVSGLRRVVRIPEQILVSVLARGLKGKARDLAIVPTNTATPGIRDSKTWNSAQKIKRKRIEFRWQIIVPVDWVH